MQKLDMVTNDKQNFETFELQLIFYGPNINNCLPKEIIVYIPGILPINPCNRSIFQFSQPCFDEKTWLLFMVMVLETNRNVQQVSIIAEGPSELGGRGPIFWAIDYYHISIGCSERIMPTTLLIAPSPLNFQTFLRPCVDDWFFGSSVFLW